MNEFCDYYAGPDPCLREAGHTGQHATYWGRPGDAVRPVMTWNGDEPWSHHT